MYAVLPADLLKRRQTNPQLLGHLLFSEVKQLLKLGNFYVAARGHEGGAVLRPALPLDASDVGRLVTANLLDSIQADVNSHSTGSAFVYCSHASCSLLPTTARAIRHEHTLLLKQGRTGQHNTRARRQLHACLPAAEAGCTRAASKGAGGGRPDASSIHDHVAAVNIIRRLPSAKRRSSTYMVSHVKNRDLGGLHGKIEPEHCSNNSIELSLADRVTTHESSRLSSRLTSRPTVSLSLHESRRRRMRNCESSDFTSHDDCTTDCVTDTSVGLTRHDSSRVTTHHESR